MPIVKINRMFRSVSAVNVKWHWFRRLMLAGAFVSVGLGVFHQVSYDDAALASAFCCAAVLAVRELWGMQ